MATALELIVPPVKGAKEAADALRKIGGAGSEAAAKVERSIGGFERLGMAFSKNAASAQVMLRALGPLGGGASVIASQIERAGLAMQRMESGAAKAASSQQVLEKAFEAGKITAATMEAAMTRLQAANLKHASTLSALKQAQADASAADKAAIAINQALEAQIIKVAEAQKARQAATALMMSTPGTGSGSKAALFDAETAAIQRENKEVAELNRMRTSAVPILNAQTSASNALNTIKKEEVVVSKEAAEAQKLMNDANLATTAGMGGTTLVIAALVAILIVLAAALYGVKKAYDFVKESIKAAGEAQASELTFKNIVNDAKLAEEQLKSLKEFADGAGAIFTDADILKTAGDLVLFGTGAKNAADFTKALGAAAAVTNVSIGAMGTAFESVMYGRIQKPTRETLPILEAIGKEINKSQSEVLVGLQKGTISTNTMAAAVIHASQEGGAWFDKLQKRANTYEGQLSILANTWESIHVALGRPIIDALTKVLQSWNQQLGSGGIVKLVDEFGKKLGDMLLKAKDANVELFFKRIATAAGAAAGFIFTVVKSVNDLVTNMHKVDEWVNSLKWVKAVQDAWKGWGAGGGPGPELPQSGKPRGPHTAMDIDSSNDPLTGNAFITKPNTNAQKAITDELRKQAQLLQQIREEQELINANPWMSPDEKAAATLASIRKEMDALGAAIKKDNELLNSGAITDDATYTQVQGEVRKLTHEFDMLGLQMQALEHPFLAAIAKWRDSFGTLVDQMVGGIKDIASAITNDLVSGLADILDGTKSVKDGFRDMALSIIKDIERIIIKMLIEYAIQQLLGGLGGLSGGGRVGTGVIGTAGSPTVGATTGFAAGGYTGDKGGVTHPHEYVLNSRATESIGIKNLDLMNRGAMPHYSQGTLSGNDYQLQQLNEMGYGGGEDFFDSLPPGTYQGWGNQIPYSQYGNYFTAPNVHGSPVNAGSLMQSVGGNMDFGGNMGLGQPWAQNLVSTYGYGTGYPTHNTGGGMNLSFNSLGQITGGMSGPQGSIYGINPNTGNPIYNANAVPYGHGEGGSPGGFGGVSPGGVGSGGFGGGGMPGGRISQFLRYGFAGGMRIPGPASTSDSIPAWLSTGEVVINAAAVSRLDAKHGRGWENRVNKFASGGRVGGSTSGGGGNIEFNIPISISMPGGQGGGGDGKKKGPSQESLADLKRQVHGICAEWATKELRHDGMLAR